MTTQQISPLENPRPDLSTTTVASEPGREPDRADYLWRTLGRFDFYIGTTISRAAAVTALNALVVGSIVLKAVEVLATFGAHASLRKWAALAITLACVAAVVSTFLAFLALVPYLGSRGHAGKSRIFFEDVAARPQDAFHREVLGMDKAALADDLAVQVHQVAQGLRGKFRLLARASRCMTFVLFPALALLALLRLVALLLDVGVL